MTLFLALTDGFLYRKKILQYARKFQDEWR